MRSRAPNLGSSSEEVLLNSFRGNRLDLEGGWEQALSAKRACPKWGGLGNENEVIETACASGEFLKSTL